MGFCKDCKHWGFFKYCSMDSRTIRICNHGNIVNERDLCVVNPNSDRAFSTLDFAPAYIPGLHVVTTMSHDNVPTSFLNTAPDFGCVNFKEKSNRYYDVVSIYGEIVRCELKDGYMKEINGSCRVFEPNAVFMVRQLDLDKNEDNMDTDAKESENNKTFFELPHSCKEYESLSKEIMKRYAWALSLI